MLADRVKVQVPNPGTVNVGSTITLGSPLPGFRSFISAFGAGATCYFVLTDGTGRALTGVWVVNGQDPQTATVTSILSNDRVPGTGPETFTGQCIAYNTLPAMHAIRQRDLAWQWLATVAVSGGPTWIEFALPLEYREFELTMSGVAPAITNSALIGHYSRDGGATWDAALNSYSSMHTRTNGASGNIVIQPVLADSGLVLTPTVYSASSGFQVYGHSMVRIQRGNDGIQLRGHHGFSVPATTYYEMIESASVRGNTGQNRIRLGWYGSASLQAWANQGRLIMSGKRA